MVLVLVVVNWATKPANSNCADFDPIQRVRAAVRVSLQPAGLVFRDAGKSSPHQTARCPEH